MTRAEVRLEILKLIPGHLGPEEVVARSRQFERYVFELETPELSPPFEDVEISTRGRKKRKSDNVDPLS